MQGMRMSAAAPALTLYKATDLIDAKVGIGGDDSSPGEVDTLSTQITSETTLLTLQPLAESSHRFLALYISKWEVSDDRESAGRCHLQAPWAYRGALS